MLDFIIVGQGIAGSMLSWFLYKKNQQFIVIDKLNLSSATHVASGITNPITGRKFVKTWLADELIAFSQSTFTGFEAIFNTRLLHDISIYKLLDSVKAQNDWSVRCQSAGYEKYLQNNQVAYLDAQKVKNEFGTFEISGGQRLESSKFLTLYRAWLTERNLLLDNDFDFSALQIESDHVVYNGTKASKIIFCEGANAVNNPYFKFLPFQLAKGECLILKVEDFYHDRIINGEAFIMPLPEKDLYYVGSTHEWHFSDTLPSEQGKNELLGNLTSFLRSPFQIIDHRAAIRPTVKDRRPFIGFNPQYGNVGIFNGMGTKGLSLAPYFAHHFAQYLTGGTELMKEVDIARLG